MPNHAEQTGISHAAQTPYETMSMRLPLSKWSFDETGSNKLLCKALELC
jgi:hypothetical protein